MIGNVAVTVERDTPGGLDQYGDPVTPDGYSPVSTDYAGCAVAPRLAIEPGGRGRDSVVVGLTLYCPPGVDIVRSDRVVITEGPHQGTYEVVGEPSDWQSGLTAWHAGVSVALAFAQG